MALWNAAARRRCYEVGATLGYWLSPGLAGAQPLNVADPTPRAILVEFEISLAPGVIGQTYSAAYGATYSATGNAGTVVITGSVYESAILTHDLDYFDTMTIWTLIPGSASDFTLDIDLATLEATAQPLTYQMSIVDPPPFPQIGTVTRELSSTTTAGFAVLPEFPGFPFFCGACTPVPGAAYDPVTGKLNAIGSDTLVAPDVPGLIGFARAGDLRLSESPAAAVPTLSPLGLWGLVAALTCLAFLRGGVARPRRGRLC